MADSIHWPIASRCRTPEGTNVGVLTLLEGSVLPAEGQGTIKVFMDSRISKDSSGALAEQFLSNGEIPIFLELKFNVGVDINFGLQHFGTTAPFDKKCGMNIGGMFQRSQNKLGPMICRSGFDELTHLPHLGDAPATGPESPNKTLQSKCRGENDSKNLKNT